MMERKKCKLYIFASLVTVAYHIFALFVIGITVMEKHLSDVKAYKCGEPFIEYVYSLFKDKVLSLLFFSAICIWITAVILDYKAIRREETGSLALCILLVVDIVIWCVLLCKAIMA